MQYSSVALFETELNAVTGIPINIFQSPPLSTTFGIMVVKVVHGVLRLHCWYIGHFPCIFCIKFKYIVFVFTIVRLSIDLPGALVG
jgi:hypothetical protein